MDSDAAGESLQTAEEKGGCAAGLATQDPTAADASEPAGAAADSTPHKVNDDPIIEDVPEEDGPPAWHERWAANADLAARDVHHKSPSSSDDESRARPVRRVPQAEQVAAKELDDQAKRNILELHAKGKNPMQIKNNYLLTDYVLSEEAVVAIIREQRQAAAPESALSEQNDDETDKSYTPQDVKTWITAVKNKDLCTIQELLVKHPSILSARQSGIGNTALHWYAQVKEPRDTQKRLADTCAPHLRAAHFDYVFELRYLIKSKADVGMRNSAGTGMPQLCVAVCSCVWV